MPSPSFWPLKSGKKTKQTCPFTSLLCHWFDYAAGFAVSDGLLIFTDPSKKIFTLYLISLQYNALYLILYIYKILLCIYVYTYLSFSRISYIYFSCA
jgi:hypothetical protein